MLRAQPNDVHATRVSVSGTSKSEPSLPSAHASAPSTRIPQPLTLTPPAISSPPTCSAPHSSHPRPTPRSSAPHTLPVRDSGHRLAPQATTAPTLGFRPGKRPCGWSTPSQDGRPPGSGDRARGSHVNSHRIDGLVPSLSMEDQPPSAPKAAQTASALTSGSKVAPTIGENGAATVPAEFAIEP